ncbi:MAG: hypothetical protein IAF38_10190 [Bacteroidia bacterium]|nr:hypothetical protein [Bacteroidia bacterium]
MKLHIYRFALVFGSIYLLLQMYSCKKLDQRKPDSMSRGYTFEKGTVSSNDLSFKYNTNTNDSGARFYVYFAGSTKIKNPDCSYTYVDNAAAFTFTKNPFSRPGNYSIVAANPGDNQVAIDLSQGLLSRYLSTNGGTLVISESDGKLKFTISSVYFSDAFVSGEGEYFTGNFTFEK